MVTDSAFAFVKELSNVDAIVGQKVVLSCEVSREGGALKWLKSGQPIGASSSPKYEFTDVGLTHSLTIDDVMFDDEAEYRCCCESAVTSCMLFVEGRTTLCDV